MLESIKEKEIIRSNDSNYVISCANCDSRFTLYGVLETEDDKKLAVPQECSYYCPYCGYLESFMARAFTLKEA